MTVMLYQGDCLEVLKTFPANSIDTVITDPPYGLGSEPDIAEVLTHWLAGDDYKHRGGGFMGKTWDSFVPGPSVWKEVYRVLKPGGMCLVFGGTRTYDLTAIALRMAGFQIRDTMMWLYGSGFPKSHDISKAIDKAAGAEREVVGYDPGVYPDSDKWGKSDNNAGRIFNQGNGTLGMTPVTAPATAAAQQWEGWGTALKPAWEPVLLAMKPLAGTFAANALAYGVSGLWIDGGRIEAGSGDYDHPGGRPGGVEPGHNGTMGKGWHDRATQQPPNPQGRWPANVILDDEAARALDAQSGERPARPATYALNGDGVGHSGSSGAVYNGKGGSAAVGYSDSGGASRFFYCAKSSRRERNIGLPEGMTNGHPTVKPLSLMQYLCRLTATPTGGVVLDPFMGSGTTGMAAVMEGRDFIGIELDGDYLEIARRRITAAAEQARQLALTLE